MSSTDATTSRTPAARASLLAFALVVGLFFLWALANNLNDILIKQFKNAFELSNLQAGLVQSAFYLGYFVLAIPAGMCMRRYGFKSGILVGLALFAIGALLFYPAAAMQSYGVFLCGLFVIASGLSFLETSANPLVTVLGPPEGGARRLNFAQSFNALGAIVAVVAGRSFIFNGVEHTPEQLAAMAPAARHAYASSQLLTVRAPYLVIAAVVAGWAVLLALTHIPVRGEHPRATATVASDDGNRVVRRLLGNRHYLSAVAAQFFYVGAQTCVWSYLIFYCQGTLPGTPEKRAADYLVASLVLFAAGRFTGTALMKFFAPRRLLATFAAINVVLCALAVALPGMTGLVALVLVSFFMSVMYPTIFALGVDGFNDAERKTGASFLVMAIVGGAVLPPLLGAISDAASINIAELVPLGCFVAVWLFAVQRGGASTTKE
ncbi:MAG: L-fucose:H+ symporter permease [Rhodanobacteraceae bacterium]|nr:MAG: L-fucose:H+ symporter permease [Rhodanobacteraceae bacterium]